MIGNVLTSKAELVRKHLDPFGGFEHLQIIRDESDDVHSFCVVVKIPDRDVWLRVLTPSTAIQLIEQNDKLIFDTENEIRKSISELPTLIQSQINGQKSWQPMLMALARFLGIYTDEMMSKVQNIKGEEKRIRDLEFNEREKLQIQKEAQYLLNEFKRFKNGELIEGDTFRNLIKVLGLPVHPRTMGSLSSRHFEISPDRVKTSGVKVPSGIWATINILKNISLEEAQAKLLR